MCSKSEALYGVIIVSEAELSSEDIIKSQKTCIKLIEDGYVHTFEEILKLMNMYKTIRREMERGLDTTKPKDFQQDPEILSYITSTLKEAEDALRRGSFEEDHNLRMQLGNFFHELTGYRWLAIYFYRSRTAGLPIDASLSIASLQRQALLEESRGNIDFAAKRLRKALKTAERTPSLDDSVLKTLNKQLCRMYQLLGMGYLEKETQDVEAENSRCLRYFKRAAELAVIGEAKEMEAASHALLGKALMKFNDDETALKSFVKYIELSEKDSMYASCQGNFAISEIFKINGKLDESVAALKRCQDLAKEFHFDVPYIFSSISLGQIETAKRNYHEAKEHFENAYNVVTASSEDYAKIKSLKKLSKIMCGIGKAHLTFHCLVNAVLCPKDLSLPKLLSWRNKGGSFEAGIAEKHFIDLDELETGEGEAEISGVVNKLMKQELS